MTALNETGGEHVDDSGSGSSGGSGSGADSSSSHDSGHADHGFDRADGYFDQSGQATGYDSYPPQPGQPYYGHPSHHRFGGRGGRAHLADAPGWVQACVWIGALLAVGGVDVRAGRVGVRAVRVEDEAFAVRQGGERAQVRRARRLQRGRAAGERRLGGGRGNG